jgi:hypothetical protein
MGQAYEYQKMPDVRPFAHGTADELQNRLARAGRAPVLVYGMEFNV